MELLHREHKNERSIALVVTELAAVEFAVVSEQWANRVVWLQECCIVPSCDK
jgi:hypothetical protein